MNFTGHLTPQGADLLAKILRGGSLTITRVLAGAGTTEEESLTLADPRQTVTISDRCTDGTLATLQVTLAASLAENAYDLTELGIYARDPEAGEILYLLYRLDQPVKIDPTSRLVLRAYLRLALSDTLSLSLELPPSGLLVEEDLMNKADLVDGQVPYEQMPHLTQNAALYVDGTTGNDANPGTEDAPFRTIQAAVDSLPKDLGFSGAEIRVASGTYDETLQITGFAAGQLDYSILIVPVSGADVRVNRVVIRSCSNVVRISDIALYGTTGPVLDIGNANVSVSGVTVSPEGSCSGGFTDCAVLISSFAHVRIFNFTVDADATWTGVRVENGALMQGYGLTVKDCFAGLQVGDEGNDTCGIVLMYHEPVYSGNSADVVVAGGGNIINNVGGAV